jgi:hypothetical protein
VAVGGHLWQSAHCTCSFSVVQTLERKDVLFCCSSTGVPPSGQPVGEKTMHPITAMVRVFPRGDALLLVAPSAMPVQQGLAPVAGLILITVLTVLDMGGEQELVAWPTKGLMSQQELGQWEQLTAGM